MLSEMLKSSKDDNNETMENIQNITADNKKDKQPILKQQLLSIQINKTKI